MIGALPRYADAKTFDPYVRSAPVASQTNARREGMAVLESIEFRECLGWRGKRTGCFWPKAEWLEWEG